MLADDHPGALAQTERLLAQDYRIVGTVSNGVELLEAVPRLNPDVVVLDISMPEMHGFEAARQLRRAGCLTKLVFLTMWEDDDFAREALRLGAQGYVVKSRLVSDLPAAINAVLAGQRYVSPILRVHDENSVNS